MNLCFQYVLLPDLFDVHPNGVCTNAEISTPVNTHSVCAEHRLEVDSFRMSGLSLSLSLPDESLLPLFLSLLEEITLSGALCLARVCPALMAVIWTAKRNTEKNREESTLTTLIPHNKNTLCHSSVFICIQKSPQTNIKCGNLWAIFAHGVPGMRCERVSDVCASLRRRAPDLPH